MSTPPPIGDAIWALLSGARKVAGTKSGLSQVDRNLAAVTLVVAAVVVAWGNRPAPKLAQQVWDRRAWWTQN